jgi:DNA ligase-1
MIHPTLYSNASNGKIKQWSIKVVKNTVITIYGYIDGAKTKTEPTIYKDNDKAKRVAQVKWNNKMKKGFVTDRKKVGRQFVLPMLAKDFRKYEHRIVFDAYVQPKLDGVRCLSHKKGNKIIFTSRNGNIFQHLEHIKDELLKTGWYKNGLYLDGELFTKKLDPEQIKGAVNIKNLTPERVKLTKKIEYHIYDMMDLKRPNLTFEQRHTVLKKMFKRYKYIKPVRTEKIKSVKDIHKYHDIFVKEGYEGVIIRNRDGKYAINQRSIDLQKYKEFFDDEFKIIGYKSGQGNEDGTIVFHCLCKKGKDSFHVRPEGSREERRRLYNIGKSLIGKKLTVKYQSIGKTGCPLNPVGILPIRGYE